MAISEKFHFSNNLNIIGNHILFSFHLQLLFWFVVQGVSHELNSCRITCIFILQSVHSLYLSYLFIFLHAREALKPIWALFLQKFSAFISNFFFCIDILDLKMNFFHKPFFHMMIFHLYLDEKSSYYFSTFDFQVTPRQPFINLFNPKP